MAEPMIAVKKADGTIVHVPLSEIKNKQAALQTASASITSPTPAKTEAKPEFKIPVPEDALVASGKLPVSEDPMAAVKKLLSVPELPKSPAEPLIPDHFADTEKPKPHAPLPLREPEAHELKEPTVLGQASYDDVVSRVLAEAKLNPPAALVSRYHSLIMSAAKGVRTVEQVLRYASLPDVQGGLGLDPGATARLGKALEHVPGVQVPVAPVKPSAPAKAIQAQLEPSAPALPVRPTMRDVEAPTVIPVASQAAAVIGPVEEMKNFSLLDWRRLAVTPDKAGEIVTRKFAAWKEESFYLYQDARAAWLQSPLIREYQKTLATLVNQNTRLSGLGMGTGNARNTITAGDVAALVAVNRSLAV